MIKDLSQINPELDEMIKRVNSLAQGMEGVNKEYNKFGEKVEQSAKKLQESQQKISGANAEEQKQLEENAKAAQKLLRAQEQYRAAMSENEQQIRDVRKAQRALIKQRELEIKVAQAAEGSYDQLAAKYALIKLRLNAMSREEREATETGRELVRQSAEIRAQMSALQRETGNHTLEVGNYENANRNLIGMFEEMPGPISNVSGAVGGLKDQFKKLLANPVVAVMAGVAAAIAAVTKSLSGSRSATSMFNRAMTSVTAKLDIIKKQFNEALESMTGTFKKQIDADGKEVSMFRLAWNKLKSDVSEKGVWETLKNNYKQQQQSSKEARKSFAQESEALKQLRLEAIKLNAAYIDTENESLQRIASLQAESDMLSIIADDDTKSMANMISARNELMRVERQRTQEESRLANMRLKLAENEIEQAILSGQIARKSNGELVAIRKSGIEIEKAYTEAKIEAMALSNEVQRVEAENAQRRRMDERDVFEQRLDFLLDIADRQFSINQSIISDQNTSYAESAKVLIETNKLVEESFDAQVALFESDLGIQLDRNKIMNLNNEEIVEYAEGLNMSEIATNRLREVIMDRRQAVQDLLDAEIELREKGYNESLKNFDDLQELDKLKAENAGKTEEEITAITTQAQIDRYRKQLELTKEFGQELSDTEIAIIEEKIKKLEGELDTELKLKADVEVDTDTKKTIWEKLGLTKDQGAKVVETLKEVYSNVLSTLKNFADQQVESINRVVEARDRDVEEAERDLDRQVELAEQGYANNVSDAQRNLELQRSARQQAEQEQAEALKRKQQLETIEQGVSLVTASANILKGWSTLPFVGQALGIAAVISMIASFVAIKAKARKATKLGDGDYIDLEGGSHASGNDFKVYENNTTEYRAEGGEGMAIFSRKAKRQYGKMIPDIVDSINHGKLEEKYTNAFNIGALPIYVENKSNYDSADIKQTNRLLKMIYEQGGASITMDQKGRIVKKTGNKTIIRNG